MKGGSLVLGGSVDIRSCFDEYWNNVRSVEFGGVVNDRLALKVRFIHIDTQSNQSRNLVLIASTHSPPEIEPMRRLFSGRRKQAEHRTKRKKECGKCHNTHQVYQSKLKLP